jgi:hypothetical protein
MTYQPMLIAGLFGGVLLGIVGTTAFAQQTKAPRTASTTPPAAQGMPKATFLSNVEAEFTAMDTNRDGKASKAEIEQHRAQLNATRLQQQNRALFARLDQDKSGSISAQEFARLAQPRGTPNVQPLVTRLDSDRDQQLSRAEYRVGSLADFERLDTNKDGRLTPAEARQASAR